MARINYQRDKRQKDLARQKKQEEKRQRKLQKDSEPDGTTDGAAEGSEESAAGEVVPDEAAPQP